MSIVTDQPTQQFPRFVSVFDTTPNRPEHPPWCQRHLCTIQPTRYGTVGAHQSPRWTLGRGRDSAHAEVHLWQVDPDVPEGHPDFREGRYLQLEMGEYQFTSDTEPDPDTVHSYTLSPTSARALAAELLRLADAADWDLS